jgi:hypothetical protein
MVMPGPTHVIAAPDGTGPDHDSRLYATR